MIKKQQLGKTGPLVGCIGYGAAGLEGYYGAADQAEGISTINHALDVGMNMIDTSDYYGNGHNEETVGKAIRGRRDDAFVATKFGIVSNDSERGNDLPTGWGLSFNVNGSADYTAKALDRSLRHLDIETIDLWYLHYPDPGTPVEGTVAAMAKGVAAGKVRYLGLSNVNADQVRRAHAIHPITAVQYEYSLWRSEAQTELLPVLRELGIALVAWSPLGYGFLTGTLDTINPDQHFRQANPRFSDENFDINRQKFAPFMEIAQQLGVTPAQLALAWLLHTGPDVFPIPGTRRVARVDENARAADIRLDQQTLDKINEMARPGYAEGATIL